MTTEPEIGLMCLPAKGQPGLPAATRNQERGVGQALPRAAEGATFADTSISGPLASTTM